MAVDCEFSQPDFALSLVQICFNQEYVFIFDCLCADRAEVLDLAFLLSNDRPKAPFPAPIYYNDIIYRKICILKVF